MAKKTISSLSVILGGTAAPFTSMMSSAGTALQGLKSQATSIGGSLLKFSGIGAAIGALAGGAGLGLLIHGQQEAIDVNAKLTDRLGISSEALGGLQYAADLSGVSSEALTGGLEKYLKTAAGAVSGNKKLAAAFTSVGLNAADLVNMPTDQAIGKIGDALNGIQNPAQRAAAAQAIFGKTGQALLPFLAEGSEGIGAMTAEARQLGLTFSRVDAGKVEEANDAWSRAGSVITGVVRQITIAIAPFLTSAANAFTAVGIKFVAAFKAAIPPVVGFVTSAFDIIVPIVVGAGNLIWGSITSTWNAIAGFIGPTVGAIASFVSTNWQTMLTAVVSAGIGAWTLVSGILSGAWTLITTIASAIGSAWSWAMDLIGVSSLGAGATTSGVVSTIGAAWLWLENATATVFTGIGFAFANWKSIVELAGTQVILSIVTVGNQVQYVLGTVIPAILSWFGNNWADIFRTIGSFTGSVLTNIGKNVWSFLGALAGALKGEGFNFEFTALTDGFTSSIKELPKIAEREIGPLEQALGDQVTGMKGTLAAGLADALAGNKKTTDTIATNVTDAIAGAFRSKAQDESAFFDDEAGSPFSTPIPVPFDTSEADAKLDKTKGKAQDLKNIGFGSAEQMQRIAFASVAEPLPASTTKTAAGTASTDKKLDTSNTLLARIADAAEDTEPDYEVADF